MELKYTHINKLKNSATMILKGIIGKDVSGPQFSNEIRYLESIGITDLEIRINSGGGEIINSYDIVDALLNTNMNTTSFIAGLAASAAGWIAMAAKKIKISNFGLLMIHPSSGGSKEINQKFNESIVNIFNSRTGISKTYLNQLMKTETFFTADEALAAGFVDEIVVTKRQKPTFTNSSYDERMKIYNKIKISIMENEEVNEIMNENLEEVTNEVNDTVEDVVETIEEVTNEVYETEIEAEVDTESPNKIEIKISEMDAFKDAVKKMEELAKVNEELTKKLAEQETLNNQLVEKENLRLKEEKDAKVSAVINEALESGKISNEVKDTWVNFITIDFDGAKKALDSIITNKKSVDIMEAVNVKVMTNQLPTEKSFRQLEKENPQELERIKNETPELFKEMYKNQYGNYPTL